MSRGPGDSEIIGVHVVVRMIDQNGASMEHRCAGVNLMTTTFRQVSHDTVRNEGTNLCYIQRCIYSKGTFQYTPPYSLTEVMMRYFPGSANSKAFQD